MNDFTKTELQDLLFCVKDHTGYQGDSIHENLIKKIQSMIDNYCDEEPNNPNFTQYQKNFICYQIGEWYLMMKPLLEGQHNLGYMKEKLQLVVCNDE